MKNNKSKLVTVILLFMTIGLMGAILYIGYVLTSTPDKSSPIAPKKTKAQNVSYNKLIALNTEGSNNNANNMYSTLTPTISVSPADARTTPTRAAFMAQASITPGSSLQPTQSLSPTVEDINIETQSLITLTPARTGSASATPTKITSLPKTGYLSNIVLMAGLAGLIIFFSFIF